MLTTDLILLKNQNHYLKKKTFENPNEANGESVRPDSVRGFCFCPKHIILFKATTTTLHQQL